MSMHFSYETTLVALAMPSILSAVGILLVREKYSYARRVATMQ